MVMENLGINSVFTLISLLVLALPVLSWMVLYLRGADARDLLFWGAIAVVISILGPLVAIAFACRLQPDKAKRERANET